MGLASKDDESRLKARENAIETLIDMHPHGAAYRAARNMNEALTSSLQSRYNRITDSALLDSANSLSKYEILTDSQEVFGDLLKGPIGTPQTEGEPGDNGSNTDCDEKPPLKDGWEARVLRHHDKIIRAKNNNSVAQPASPRLEDGSANKPPPSPPNKTAVPPPRLISALRQIFDSPSSTDLKGLTAPSGGESSATVRGDKSEPPPQQHQQVNVLPSLLHAVVNHAAFSSEPHSSPPSDSFAVSVKRHLATLFDSPPQKKRSLDATEEREARSTDGKAMHHTDSNKESSTNTAPVTEIGSPTAANLEAIIGNVCRNILGNSAGASGGTTAERVNSNIHGLLIASLSIMTVSLLEGDNLDEFTYSTPEHSTTTSLEGGSITKSTSSRTVRPDSSSNATPDPNLQVGGLLALLNVTPKEGDKFLVETSLSRYFAEASSAYEERIEIQKAMLQTGSSSKEKRGSEGFSTPKEKTKRSSINPVGTPPLPLENLVNADNAQNNDYDNNNADANEVTDADEDINAPEDDDGLPSATLRDSDELTREDVANVTRMLLSNIANIVGADVLNFDDEDDGEDEAGVERDADDMDNYVDSDGEDDEEEGEEDESDEDSETTREYSGQEAGMNEDVQSDNHEERENRASNDDNANNDEEEETAMLQRALALSLAATVSAGASDSSNSDGSENERIVSAATAPSARLKNLTSEDLKRKSSAESTKSALSTATEEGDESKRTHLPPLPTPPSLDLLPRNSSTDECPENEIAAVLDPAALSRFGNLPASHVLVHLLQSMLGIMESDINNGNTEKPPTKSSADSAAKLLSSAKTPLSRMKKYSRKQSHDSARRIATEQDDVEFVPDPVTSQLLMAALHLSSFLRGYSIAALSDILLCEDDANDDLAEEADRKDETIQIADSVESEDPIFEKEEDPALFVVASQSSLESKGLKRKAAAAADISVLRHHTKQKLVGMWIERASFYSVSSYIIMRCLRIVMAKCLKHGLYFSDVASSCRSNIIYMSTKSRIGLSRILSSFHSLSVPGSFRTLQESLDTFCAAGNSQSKHLLDELFVSSLCKESLWLWGLSIPFTCHEHMARIDLLRDLSLSPTESTAFSIIEKKVKTASWNALDLRNIKLDILCQRLRMSDMLDYFVVRPKLRADDEPGTLLDQNALNASLTTISMLGTMTEKHHPNCVSSKEDSLPNVAQLYFALCARSISSLILWNDLLLSPTEFIDQNTLKMSLNPSNFHFDATKCADSIAIDPPGATANQRAAKVWGTVLSTTYFLPKTGVHRFAVKLDKCERGHVFVGVATARASVKTYVGGDKNGWGCIGTQALWHDRNKIRGDYGAMVRTGAVIVATLDTDLGTLSFGLWKDALPDSEDSSGPMSPSMASLASPHRGLGVGNVSGSLVEDWGIAFEGLPLDVKLYPAVGLYQRDDRATLYTISNSVTSAGKSSIPPIVSSGYVYFPSVQESKPDHVAQIRSWNQTLCSNGISFAIDILARSIKLLSSETEVESSVLLSIILPPLASAICLIPSCIPCLSAKYAMELLPLVTRCAKLIDRSIFSNNRHSSLNVEMKEGSWVIHAELSTSTEPDPKACVEFEEYVIEFKRKPLQDESIDAFFQGKGTSSTGRVPHGYVYTIGAVRGTRLQFIEEWTDEDLAGQDVSFSDTFKSTSSCVINARLGLDGKKFEGVYHNVQHGTSGNISGVLQTPSVDISSNENFNPSYVMAHSIDDRAKEQCEFIRTESILCLAAGHLALVLRSPTVMSDVDNVGDLTNDELEKLKRGQEILQDLVESSLIISGGRLSDASDIRSSIDSVWERCRALEIKDYGDGADIVEQWQDLVYFDLFSANDTSLADVSPIRLEIERQLEPSFVSCSLGNVSFSRLCPVQYNGTWKKLASVILYHCGNDFNSDCVRHAVETSRQIMENGIRDALFRSQFSATPRSDICEQHCLLLDNICEFLFEFSCYSHTRPVQAVMDEFVYIFKTIHSYADLDALKRSMTSLTEKSIMHYVGIRAIQLLLASEDSYEGIQLCPAIESAITSLTRLCSKSQSHSLTSISSGCPSSVQVCFKASLQSIYNRIESIFATINSAEDLVLLSSLILSLYTAVESNPTKFMLDKCNHIMSQCRNLAFREKEQSSIELTFVNTIRMQCAQRILQTTTAALQSFASAISQQGEPANSFLANDAGMVQLIVSRTMQEVLKTVPIVAEKYKIDRNRQEMDGIGSDWDIYQISQGVSETAMPSEKGLVAMGMTSFAETSSMLSTKNAMSPSHGYLCQLLDLLHYFVNTKPFSRTLEASALEISSSLITAMNAYLPTNTRLRILRILRPVLLATEANLGIVEQLLSLAGLVSYHLDLEHALDNDDTPNSCDAASISGGAVATLRHLYGSRSWKSVIHEAIITSYSPPSVCGVLSFFGGMPGCLQPGSFLIIEPEIASSLLSTTSAFIGKSRGSSSGVTASSMSISAGRGVEGIISGLCRQSALAGQLCSFDAKSGMCEVIVMSNRLGFQETSNEPNPKVTVRAVRVSSAEIASAYELPLFIDGDMPATHVLRVSLEQLKSSSSVTRTACSSHGQNAYNKADESAKDLPSLKQLFTSAMSIRSLTVLLSDPDVLQQQFASSDSNELQTFLELALQWACIKQGHKPSNGLSSLPGLEAQLWHLFSVRSILQSKKIRLETMPGARLNDLFKRELQEKKTKAPSHPSPVVSGYRTPPPSLANSFFGSLSERVSRTSTASTAAREEIAGSTRDDEDDEESQNASHLREAAIVQMAELGLPRQWAELALRRTGDIEAAVHFCLERGADMERLIAEEERTRGSSSSTANRRRGLGVNSRMNSSQLISQLVDMGFPRHWCVSALSATSNNVDEALTWILTNGDRLSAEAEDENEKEEESDEEVDNWDQDESEEGSVGCDKTFEDADRSNATAVDSVKSPPIGWSGSICPIRFISGRSKINPQTLEIAGLKDGGFSSVGTKGVLLTSGKWYYEAEVLTAGCLQIGWADSSFAGHCQADRGDGCGDGPSSWAFDGWRRYRWHSTATEWGCRWSEGDVVGCLVDMDEMNISFTLNGKGEEIGMGMAFSEEGFRPCSGVYCCVSFNSREKVRLVLGGEGTEPFKYIPDGYRGVGDAILSAVKERQMLLDEEKALLEPNEVTTREKPPYLCDFSDGEHGHELFSWQHRYYGSDASVHLGGNRAALRGASSSKKTSKGSTVSLKASSPVLADVAFRLSKAFEKSKERPESDADGTQTFSDVSLLKDAYTRLLSDVDDELKAACMCVNVLYAKKLVLHLLIAYSSKFSVGLFLPKSPSLMSTEDDVSKQLYQVVESTTSISTWLGEAGAMAVAAEALGLGISTYDSNISDSPPAGMCSASSDQVIVCGGISQFLSSAVLPDECKSRKDGVFTPWTFAAASEAAVGSDSGGALSFIRRGLQNALVLSKSFRLTLLAGVRRAIRVLSDDDTDMIASERKRGGTGASDLSEYSPDARLVAFMTGVLLSKPVKKQLSESENNSIMCSLFEGWCVGLLSASSPWRMICATTAAGILNMCPTALFHVTSRIQVIADYLWRLDSTTARRVWAERAAVPVCSKYSQALIELLSSVKRALRLCPSVPSTHLPRKIRFDAATPLPFIPSFNRSDLDRYNSWEWDEGWISSNEGWEVWTGTVEIMEVEWKAPQRSIVRTLMDGGEGPPFLGVGCVVMRGVDWGNRNDAGNEDGKDIYEKDKLSKEMEILAEEATSAEQECEEGKAESDSGADPALDDGPSEAIPLQNNEDFAIADEKNPMQDCGTSNPRKSDKKKKVARSKLPIGTVLSVEPWRGIPGMARRVRWHLTGKEGVYRYGGDGGRFDIAHIEVNEKETRVKKRHPLPESMEQIASRYGFGQRRTCNVILRLNNPATDISQTSQSETVYEGILEWPDFGAGIHVECVLFSDGAISITEKKLLYGAKDSGWEARFGDPSYSPGTVTVISPISDNNSLLSHEELLGSSSFLVKNLRNREQDGGRLRVISEMRLFRSRKGTYKSTDKKLEKEYAALYSSPSQLQQIRFDPDFHASSLSLSKDKRTVTCSNSEGRGTAYGNVGFTTGVHYWEVKIEKAEIGSVFIGVAEKPGSPSGSSQGSSFGFESKPRLNRWLGWGFVNFRATYTAGAERVYGSHCHSGDTVGVLLDCDSGRISYFFDGVKYGEHILNDLGCAFENLSPFGFNADGCGSGGAGQLPDKKLIKICFVFIQGAPSGVDGVRSGRYPSNGLVRPRALWPVIGLRHPGDRVTMSSKWITSHGVHPISVLKNTVSLDEIFCAYETDSILSPSSSTSSLKSATFPQWFVKESYLEYKRWQSGRWLRSPTRGSGPYRLASYGLDIDLDTTPLVCAAACACIGLPFALLPGDKVDVKRSAGRVLELQEEAVVLGAYQGRLWYRLVSQKSEGGSLMEGGGRAWFWDESEAVEGGLQLKEGGRKLSVELPKIERFKPSMSGLKIVYVGGAVVRSDLEIFDGSANIGTIPHGTTIPESHVIERRLNSCGVVRFLIDYEPIGRGWISSRIRGGKEESIVEILPLSNEEPDRPHYITPEDSAKQWYTAYLDAIESEPHWPVLSKKKQFAESLNIETIDDFGKLMEAGYISGMNQLESDSFISSFYGKISDVLPHSDEVDCPFIDCAILLASAVGPATEETEFLRHSVDAVAHEIASESLSQAISGELPPIKAIMARISMLRALNRRSRFALPWLSLRPAQEGSAVLGGLSGLGASLERAGRTWDTKSIGTWVQVPSISSRLRECKNLLFPSIKKSFLDSVMDATATPTPLSHDEYELPREVRTVRVNRLKARQAMSSDDGASKRKHSVFSQLQREMRGWSGATLRRGFVAKGHGGQKRAFKVKLVGEGVNDYSGPYREVFTDAMLEVIDIDRAGHSSLGVLEPTSNNEADLGDGRDLFMFANSGNTIASGSYTEKLSSEEKEMLNSFSTLTRSTTEHSREVEDALVFLGKLAGTACRHGIPVDLPLPLGVVWDRLAEERFNVMKVLQEIDLLAYRRTTEEDHHGMPVPSANTLLSTQRRMLNSFAEGMSSVLPVELLTLFTGKQLRDILCGNPDIDVELLRRVVEYEGYNESDDVISYLWEVLREMTTSERKLFLQFVWARNRLPLKEADFDAPFRILKDTKGVKEGEDYPLPSASTCFFSLILPQYPHKEMLKQKLLFAIENVTTMESDYVTNDVEVSEGWRGL
eukprot:CCRYP_007226-RB/>CCRYP_007226-RB protein AED:0.02 eAED:0.02 QI:214/0.83/0.84/1/1/1/13/1126/5186